MNSNKEPHMNKEAGKKKKHGIITYPDTIGPYTFGKTIGEGAFSIVKLVFHELYLKRYACKIVPIRMLEERDLYKRFELEIRISQIMRHSGVASITDVLKDENNFYIFMEYYPHGNLLNYIIGKTKLDEEEAKGLIYQIFDAIQYVHTQKVSHRDLKPENIMIDDSGRLRISDFGLSRFVGDDNLVQTPCGSPCYVSPECISGKKYDGLISDAWSCGVILYAMVTGMLPWTKRKMSELFSQIKRGDYKIPSYVSDQCQNLIKMLLNVDPLNRITLEEAKNHTWFTSNNKDLRNYINYSIPIQFLKQTNPEENEIQPVIEEDPYLSTKKVDIYFRPDIDFDIDNDFNNAANIHTICDSSSQNKYDVSLPYLKFDSTMKILEDSIKVRKRRVSIISNDSFDDQSDDRKDNINLNIVSSSGQLIISNKLYTKENTPHSILADYDANNNDEKVDENIKQPEIKRRKIFTMKNVNRKSAKLPKRFQPLNMIN